MTAPTMPAAPARVGVAAGWFCTSIRAAAATGHRLTLNPATSRPSTSALCGRTINGPNRVPDDTVIDHCVPCAAKAAQAADPAAPKPVRHLPPPVRRDTGAYTAPQPNSAAARTARRASFRRAVDPDGGRDYTPHPYGMDAAARATASLRRTS